MGTANMIKKSKQPVSKVMYFNSAPSNWIQKCHFMGNRKQGVVVHSSELSASTTADELVRNYRRKMGVLNEKTKGSNPRPKANWRPGNQRLNDETVRHDVQSNPSKTNQANVSHRKQGIKRDVDKAVPSLPGDIMTTSFFSSSETNDIFD
uniref:Uncharacterized protein n=1 Tax=Cacopsylla melanoneura TaxID=428564 RepID=A0A8D9F8I7_9HEMI